MDNDTTSPSPSLQTGNNNQRLVIIAQLLQAIGNMRHIDEVFLWLANTFRHRLHVQVAQFWTYQAYKPGRYAVDLRAAISQNAFFPLQVVNNAQFTAMIEDLFIKQTGVSSQPVTHLFSAYQREFLIRYNLNYWSCLFFKSTDLLPPPIYIESTTSSNVIPTPLTMMISLFTEQSPSPSLLPTLRYVLEQALFISRNRRMVEISSTIHLPEFSIEQPQDNESTLQQIVPHALQDVETVQASNPFANTTVISDPLARQLYFAIDGKKDLVELAYTLHLDQKELILRLHYLLKQKHVRLYDHSGKLLDNSFLFDAL